MWLLLAASAAVCFGLRGILYQWTSRQPADRNVLLFGVYACGAVVALGLNVFWGQSWTAGALVGIAMGLFSFVSNSAMHKGFAVGKASLVALLVGLPPLIVVLAAMLLWDEHLSMGQTLCFVVILGGGLLVKSAGGLSLRNMEGAQWGLLAMVTFAFTDLSSKQAALSGGETLPTLVLMYVTGSLLFAITAVFERKRQQAGAAHEAATLARKETAAAAEEKQAPRWSLSKTFGVGMAVGVTNISGMILMMPAMKMGVTGLVSAIIALNALIIMLYAWTILRERVKPLELAGMILAFAGVLALRLLG
ncbi:MAG: hypothetical protein K0Q90_2095 [Paenibacillaceae bacterium]|nr:hypothetical protein [Paenibacillaceae bacterium]